MGLDREHLWFVGTGEAYWNSDVKCQCPQEFDESRGGLSTGFGEEAHNAGETTVGEMVEQLGLEERDRICYLYDYGDEWRFYAILTEIVDDGSDERNPEVVASTASGSSSTGPVGDTGQNEQPCTTIDGAPQILRSPVRSCSVSVISWISSAEIVGSGPGTVRASAAAAVP
jgi:hypothetical protein